MKLRSFFAMLAMHVFSSTVLFAQGPGDPGESPDVPLDDWLGPMLVIVTFAVVLIGYRRAYKKMPKMVDEAQNNGNSNL